MRHRRRRVFIDTQKGRVSAGFTVAAEADAADGTDCAVIATEHRAFDYARIAKSFPLIVDTRNALKGIAGEHIFRL